MAGKLVLDIINAQGTKLMTAKKIYVRDGKIAMDGNIMGTMPGQFYITPLNLYKGGAIPVKTMEGDLIIDLAPISDDASGTEAYLRYSRA